MSSRAEKTHDGAGKTRECLGCTTGQDGVAIAGIGTESAQPNQLGLALEKLGAENITGLLVEGGGEVNASFLLGGFAQRVVFFYGPRILGGRDVRKASAAKAQEVSATCFNCAKSNGSRLGADLMLTAKLVSN